MDRVEWDEYEEGSWDAYDYTVTGHLCKTVQDDRGAYLPSPMEIEQRKKMLHYLQLHGFKKRFVYAVMHYDHPGFRLVTLFVERHGAREAERILTEFLPNARLRDDEPNE